MGWFCDAYSRIKAENEQLKDEVDNLKVNLDAERHLSKSRASHLNTIIERQETELKTLHIQAQLYDRLMKGLRINVNLDGKKK